MFCRLHTHVLVSMFTVSAVSIAITGCGGAGVTDEGAQPVVSFSGDNLSGADMTQYQASGQIGAAGGTVALDDGTAVVAPAGGTVQDAQVGIRPATSVPGGDWTGEAVSGWYEGAVSLLDLDASAGAPFVIQVVANPPAEAIGHPGLRLMMVLADGQAYPVDGVWVAESGVFQAAVLALPSSFAFAVTFQDSIQRIDSADVPDEQVESAVVSALVEGPWSTVEFVIDFDGQKVTMGQAQKVARAARTAARRYSAAGFVEPFLYKDSGIPGERWHIHLTDNGSAFDSSSKPASADVAERFGRLFVSTDRIDALKTASAGSVLASIAHEMFHAVFYSYGIPYLCFNYESDGAVWCYSSSNGFNEGAATAVGYMIDQGEAKPRPVEAPNRFSWPVGYFSETQKWAAYKNQDFVVYLLRIGGLSNVEGMLRSLKTAVMPVGGGDNIATLTAYLDALETGGVGLGVGFTEMLGGYVANRGFIREPEGHIWPAEPNGGVAGAMYTLDKTLFGSNVYPIGVRDCWQVDDGTDLECSASLPGLFPATGALFTVNIDALEKEWDVDVEFISATAETTGGKVAYWLAGEFEGVGEQDGYVNAIGPTEASLPLASLWDKVHVLAAQGVAEGDVTVDLKLGTTGRGLVFEGTATVVDTYVPTSGGPGICTQQVFTTLEVDVLATGWVEVDFTLRDVQFGYTEGNATCTLLESTWNQSYWNDSHPVGSFSLAAGSEDTWLDGTYDENSATGYGTVGSLGGTREVTFNLARKR